MINFKCNPTVFIYPPKLVKLEGNFMGVLLGNRISLKLKSLQ